MKTAFLVLFLGLFLFVLGEFLSRVYLAGEVKSFSYTPNSPDAFGTYTNFLEWAKRIGYVQDYVSGSGLIYSHYTATLNRPNFSFKLKNFEMEINDLGFRSKKI